MTASPTPDRAAVKSYYRLVDRPDESQVTPLNILAPHRTRTIARMRDQETVLFIQNRTDLNFATRPGGEGLGIIGRNQTSSKTLGLHLHLTLAVTGEGRPLGRRSSGSCSRASTSTASRVQSRASGTT